MVRRMMRQGCFLLLLTGCFLPIALSGTHTTFATARSTTLADFPTVDPDYIYDQLFYMTTHFPHREAGYDTNLPANVNGHDEFADYWSQEMLRDLQGFGTQVLHDSFNIQGWQNRPAKVPAFNVEVSVPGLTHPEQVVIIGCHYDGEAISTQSANDDASGCAIELGVAKAMASYWRAHHVYPARTLRFVIFDAEEQGLYGSFHYLASTINGDVQNLVAMFNEEQSGITYPLRYLGQLANPLMPSYIEVPPLKNNENYPHQDQLSQQQQQHITQFRTLMQQAIGPVFDQFRALGYDELTYHDAGGKNSAQPIFTTDQQKNVVIEDDNLGSSDQMPFTLAGLPAATFVGNDTFYDSSPPPGSYPFDQAQDTIQLMNTFADGSSHKSFALTLSLGLPGMLTTWMLNQPTILGQASSDQNPIAAISDIGLVQPGQALTVDAKTSFDPATCNSGTCTPANLTYSWDFGDGGQATGITATHTYTTSGTVTLTLTVRSPSGQRQVRKTLSVVAQPTVIQNPYQDYMPTGTPRPRAVVTLPTPNDSLSDSVPDRVLPSQPTITPTPIITPTPTTPRQSTARPSASSSGLPPGIFVIIGIVAALLLLLIFWRWRSTRNRKSRS